MNVNVAKLTVAVVTLLCVTVLLAIKSLDQAVGVPIITSVLGYMLGNGVTALRGQTAEPIIKPGTRD